jgi:transglutaminase/protease-like cytokinesis protein 3
VNELVAEDVLKKRTAFCYGYSRFFKCLCDYADIPCEIINGYGRGDVHQVGKNFRTNHSRNAVKLDSNWYLIDVTWASGYFTYNNNQFIKHFDDQYFLTLPEQFALDHFPDDLKWSLLQQPPASENFCIILIKPVVL